MSKIFIEESSLTSIGNAIRAKTGGSANLTVPNGMVAAINSIQSGGDGTETPTQFTNYARATETVVRNNYRINSTGALASSSGNSCISFKNPKPGQEFNIVYRGAFISNGATNIAAGTSSSVAGTMISADVNVSCLLNEQGDFYITVPADKSLAWIHFSFAGLTTKRFPIIAVDEYIGNGGYTG